jgi:hypothetical protein
MGFVCYLSIKDHGLSHRIKLLIIMWAHSYVCIMIN